MHIYQLAVNLIICSNNSDYAVKIVKYFELHEILIMIEDRLV